MPPQEITGISNSVRPKRRYFIAAKIRTRNSQSKTARVVGYCAGALLCHRPAAALLNLLRLTLRARPRSSTSKVAQYPARKNGQRERKCSPRKLTEAGDVDSKMHRPKALTLADVAFHDSR